jgi:hypothetical protein
MTIVTATVLCIKQYPCDEWAVKLDQSPVVIGLRDVKIYNPDECNGSYLRSVTDIRVGMNLIMHDTGVWNVNTTTLHNAKVSLNQKSVVGTDLGGSDLTQNLGLHEPKKCITALPPRRKHSAMSNI